MITNESLNIISKKIIQSYLNTYGNNVIEVLLYGSYARGDYTDESDIDYVAIIKGERVTLQNMLKTVWKDAADIGLEYDVLVTPTMIPLNDFEKYKHTLPYYANIMKEGKKIVL